MKNNFTIKQLRLMNNLTQFELAKELGISSASYSLKEKGIRTWQLHEAVHLCNHFGISLENLTEVQNMLMKFK